MLYEVFAIAVTIFNLSGEPIHFSYIDVPDVQTCHSQVKDYEARNIQANCVLVMRKVDY